MIGAKKEDLSKVSDAMGGCQLAGDKRLDWSWQQDFPQGRGGGGMGSAGGRCGYEQEGMGRNV